MEHVNHPKHYNSHPNGIECIDIIRHYVCDIANAIKYLWWAGLKVPSKQVQCDACIDITEREEARPIGQTEMGMEDAEKEIEDLKKALWYVGDFIDYSSNIGQYSTAKAKKNSNVTDMDVFKTIVEKELGHTIKEITEPYCDDVSMAMSHLLMVGLVGENGCLYMSPQWDNILSWAHLRIQSRIFFLERTSLPKKD